MTNTQKYAIAEFDILEKTTPDALILEFKKEILELCEAFGNSGQSGFSAPYTAFAISEAIKKLCLKEPICDITGDDSEQIKIEDGQQNSRCSGLFKQDNGECYYINAIVQQGEEEYDSFTGGVYIDDIKFEPIRSSQLVNFPFKPKTFYVDVEYVYITKEEAEKKNIKYAIDYYGNLYYVVLKDVSQLDDVFKYYKKNKHLIFFYCI